jgi:hypothetical protein
MKDSASRCCSDLFNWKASLVLIGTKLGSQATRDHFYEVLGLMITIGYVIGPLVTISAFTVCFELTAWLFTVACLMLLLLLVTQWNCLLPNFDMLTRTPPGNARFAIPSKCIRWLKGF